MPVDSGRNGTGTCLMRRFGVFEIVFSFRIKKKINLGQGFSSNEERRQAGTTQLDSVYARKGGKNQLKPLLCDLYSILQNMFIYIPHPSYSLPFLCGRYDLCFSGVHVGEVCHQI